MRPIAVCAAAFALLAAPAAAEPRYTLLASDGTGYALEATATPDTFALSDDLGSDVVETRLPEDGRSRAIRVAASARCMAGGTRLLRVYGTAGQDVRRVRARTEGGARFGLRLGDAPAGWDAAAVFARLIEIRDARIRLTATGRRGKQLTRLTISFSQRCSPDGAPVLAASLTPTETTLETTAMTARLAIPARATASSYSVNLVQPPWSAGRGAFTGSPWGSPLGPAGDAMLDGPGTVEGATPALAQVGDVCLRGFARVVNTVIVRVPAGEATTLVWPLAVAPEGRWDTTRTQVAFRVRRGDYGAKATSNVAAYDGPLGVRFDLRARKRSGRVVVRGSTHPALPRRRVTVYVLQARDRPAGEQLFGNDFRPYRTLRVRTDSRGRLRAAFAASARAYRIVAEAPDTPGDRVDDRSCWLERDYR